VNFLLVSMRFRFWGASEKKTFIGRLVDGCPVLRWCSRMQGGISVRLRLQSHSQLARGPCACRSNTSSNIHASSQPGSSNRAPDARGGGRLLRRTDTSCSSRRRPSRVRCRVTWCLPEGPSRLSRKRPFQHSLRHPSLHEFRTCSRT
jgi:hypothetical protein